MPYLDVKKLRNSARYKRMRRKYLAANPLCEICLLDGLTTAATELDHIKPHKEHPELFWDTGNLQALCYECHHVKTMRENKERGGWKNKPLEQAFLVEIRKLTANGSA